MPPLYADDPIYKSWIDFERPRAEQLARDSDRLELVALDDHHFVARFDCRGLVVDPGGDIGEHTGFEVGVHFDEDYLRRAPNALRVIGILSPRNIYHSNARGPVCCIGPIQPGTSLVELLYRTHAVLTWNEYATLEPDSLNPAACQFARNHPERFPVDDRPLKRRSQRISLDGIEVTP